MRCGFRLFVFSFMLVGTSTTVFAQHWTDAIFPEGSHDFGTVARGSKLRFRFRLINTTNYDIHILEARPKCGCTEVKIGARDIPPSTSTEIEATLDTTRFNGYKASGLTLVMDRPSFAEKDLNLTCFIRGDVLLNPGGVEFGVVGRATTPSQVLTLNYMGGNPNWGVTKVTTVSPHLSARVDRITTQTGVVQYQITATLAKSAPVGYFKDEINLLTNDPSSPSIPISVAANVQAAVTVSPAILNLGRIKVGQTVTKEVLVRSNKPFKVTGASSKRSELTAGQAADSLQPFHKLTLTLKAPNQPGPFNGILEIATDLKDEPAAKVSTFATIVP